MAVEDMQKTLSPQEWQDVEGKVDEAGKHHRESRKASAEVYRDTKIPASPSLDESGEIPEHQEGQVFREDLSEEEIIERSENPRVVGMALEKKAIADQTAKEIMGLEGSPENELAELREQNLKKALREENAITREREALAREKMKIMRSIKEEPSSFQSEALREINSEISALDKKEKDLIESSPEAYYGIHLKEMKKYKAALGKGEMVETAYVKEQIDDLLTHLNAGQPVFIHGHLGAGKTEMAGLAAKKYLGKKALIISGSKNMSSAEIYGHQVLDIDKIDGKELDKYSDEVDKKYKSWVDENKAHLESLTENERLAEKQMAHDRILQLYISQFGKGTISKFLRGPIYKAMEEGRPVIFDEVNAIPHEVLISLNDLLTKRVGDTIGMQQDSNEEVTIKQGYGVIMTGNLNQGDSDTYLGRQGMDPAFLDRLYKMEYDYLPQGTETGYINHAGPENELFHLLLAKVMDRHGTASLPGPKDSSIRNLWNLACAARVFQDVFSGKAVEESSWYKMSGENSIKPKLNESVLSMRGLSKIISSWQKEGYTKKIDYYIWKEFISDSTSASDKAYFYQLMQGRFGFFEGGDKGGGWDRSPDYGKGGAISRFDVKIPDDGSIMASPKMMSFGPREIVDAAFGKPPKRAEWPTTKVGNGAGGQDEAQDLEAMMGFEDFLREIDDTQEAYAKQKDTIPF
ncbi:MAG: AAA family ATPase [bacterium]|nr:AAA family ATPase [bacterium]